MRPYRIAFMLCLILSSNLLSAQEHCTYSKKGATLDNGIIKRELRLEDGRFFTSDLSLNDGSSYCIPAKSKEFSFLLNDELYTGFSGWEILKTTSISDETGGEGVTLTLKPKSGIPKLELELSYMIYADMPVIRKWMGFKNTGKQDIKLEAVLSEAMVTSLVFYWSEVYHDFARTKSHGYFVGNWNDPLVVVHDQELRAGMALGNEAMGVIKRTAYNTGQTHAEMSNVEIGLTLSDQDYPFRKWLKPGDLWLAPKTFICLYEDSNEAFDVVNHQVNEFMIKHMQPRIVKVKEKPTFLYNTWLPFMYDVNDTLVNELIDIAAQCGIEEFCIDDGWSTNASGYETPGSRGYGDWAIDEARFQGGLKPTFDHAKSLGIHPGLWISVSTASVESEVYKTHPEWFVQDSKGNHTNLQHLDQSGKLFTGSFGTDWVGHIKTKILELVKEQGLAYVKLDFAVATSAYVHQTYHSGSYATDHPYYRDHPESFIVFYERIQQLFADLHREAPDLFIDCTYETAGRPHLMDYAIANFAEGNWLSNFMEPSPVGPLRIRNLAWWRSPVVPASSLVIGNFLADDPGLEFGMKSLIGTMPVMLGDLRKLSEADKQFIHEWADWIKEMQKKYDYMSYRKDLPGFGEPREGSWDGWQRINFQTNKGGIFGVFKQAALEDSRQVFLNDLESETEYSIRLAPHGRLVHRANGEELMHIGFSVSIEKDYDGKIFEVGID